MASVKLLKCQREVLNSTAKHTCFLAGIGVGKSFMLAHQLINWISKYPNTKYLVASNTYTQLINATVTTIKEVFDEIGIPYKVVLGGSRKYMEVLGCTIYFYSLEKFDNIRGIEVSGVLFDEVAFSKKEAVNVCLGRMRGKGGPLQARYFTSPNGYNWLYEMFSGKDGKGKSDREHLIRAKTSDNIFLPDGYYDDLLQQYGGIDSPLARQELFGEFVNLNAGAIYWAFKRSDHVAKVMYQDTAPYYIGVDFNVDNMNAVVMQFVRGKFQLIHRISLTGDNSNSYDLAEAIKKYIGNKQAFIIPDSTGKARKSSSATTDHQIFRDAGLTVMETSNPAIRDRQNAVNIAFKNNLLEIDESCGDLIKEIESLSSRENEGKVSHAAVAMGYVVWKLAPLRKPQKPSRTVNI